MEQNDILANNMYPQSIKDYKLAIVPDNLNMDIHHLPQDIFSKAFNQIFSSSFINVSVNNEETFDNKSYFESNKVNKNNNFSFSKNEELCDKVKKDNKNKKEDEILGRKIIEKIASIPTKILVIILYELNKMSNKEKNKENEINELLLEKKILNELIKRVILAIKMRRD